MTPQPIPKIWSCTECDSTGVVIPTGGFCQKCKGAGGFVEQIGYLFPDPIGWARRMWPHIHFYDKQKEVIYSVIQNVETVVPAGNELGKDFVAAFIALYYFIHRDPVIVVTTSVADDHLRVLWGEMGGFIASAADPIDRRDGGGLNVNHREIRKVFDNRIDDRKVYLWGAVSEKGEKMQGHHQTYNLFIVDEASGVDDMVMDKASTWADKILVIGNPWPCSNFFYRAVHGRVGSPDKGGDVLAPHDKWYYRKVIHIGATDSPNVRYALGEKRKGIEPSNTEVVPGLKTYDTYLRNRMMWDKIQQCVSLDGKFYLGHENMLILDEWLDAAAERAKRPINTGPKAIGIDSAQGGDNTVYTVLDTYKVIEQISKKTPDTTKIIDEARSLMSRYNIPPENVMFDRGGGGKEHADRMRRMGHLSVRTVAFGETAGDPKKHDRGMKTKSHRVDVEETRQFYKNRRAEMYGMLREALQPDAAIPLSIPQEILDRRRSDGKATLREQLTLMPYDYDNEGRMFLPPKRVIAANSKEKSLIDIIGCSPDESDSLVVGLFALRRKSYQASAGAA